MLSNMFENFDCRAKSEEQKKIPFKPYIRCEICVNCKEIGDPLYIHCNKYNMLSDRLKTCRASKKNEN